MKNLQAKHATSLTELVTQRLQQRKQQEAAKKSAEEMEQLVRRWFANRLGIDLPEHIVVANKKAGREYGSDYFHIVMVLPQGNRANGRIQSLHAYRIIDGELWVSSGVDSSWLVERNGASASKTFTDFVDAAIYLQVGK